MAKAGTFVCLLIVTLDFAAGFLSIQAHITKDKDCSSSRISITGSRNDGECQIKRVMP
ncbi:hypothetical protein Goarm_019772, partial [Gossypium armourianum]|nr:hypothetical protein [Gossypium armourianum]